MFILLKSNMVKLYIKLKHLLELQQNIMLSFKSYCKFKQLAFLKNSPDCKDITLSLFSTVQIEALDLRKTMVKPEFQVYFLFKIYYGTHKFTCCKQSIDVM